MWWCGLRRGGRDQLALKCIEPMAIKPRKFAEHLGPCINLAGCTSADCTSVVAAYLADPGFVSNKLAIAYLVGPLVVDNTLAVAYLDKLAVTIPCFAA